MANTKPAAIDRVGGSRVLFHNGTESWIAQQIMLDRRRVRILRHRVRARLRRRAGAAAQADGRMRNAGERHRDPQPAGRRRRARAPQLGRERLRQRAHEVAVEGADPRGKWIRILQHVRWSTDPGTGYIATWINGRPVQPSLDGNSKRVERTGDEVRIHTWTLKDGPGVDHLRNARPTRARTCATACTATRGCKATASCTWTARRSRRRAPWRRQARDSGEPGPSIPRLSFRYRVFAAWARWSAPLAGV